MNTLPKIAILASPLSAHTHQWLSREALNWKLDGNEIDGCYEPFKGPRTVSAIGRRAIAIGFRSDIIAQSRFDAAQLDLPASAVTQNRPYKGS